MYYQYKHKLRVYTCPSTMCTMFRLQLTWSFSVVSSAFIVISCVSPTAKAFCKVIHNVGCNTLNSNKTHMQLQEHTIHVPMYVC